MNEVVQEWIDKAQGDFNTARRELGAIDAPNYDAVGYHSQQCVETVCRNSVSKQCVEKLMKALMIEVGVRPPKIHKINLLDPLLSEACPEWAWPARELQAVSRAAIDSRYPGETLVPERARAVFELATAMRRKLLTILGVGG